MKWFKRNFKASSNDQVFDLGKKTKKAVNVLQDLFGDGEHNTTTDGLTISPRRKLVCLILAIFFGLAGVHRLYLGDILYFFLHLLVLFFIYLAYQILPDNGLTILVGATLILWVVADILAIIFSRIMDSKNRAVVYWF